MYSIKNISPTKPNQKNQTKKINRQKKNSPQQNKTPQQNPKKYKSHQYFLCQRNSFVLDLPNTEVGEDWGRGGWWAGDGGGTYLRAKAHGKGMGPRVTVAGESFPVFGLRSVTSLFNVGLRRDRVFNCFKKKKKSEPPWVTHGNTRQPLIPAEIEVSLILKLHFPV